MPTRETRKSVKQSRPTGQVVLVLQGGGALAPTSWGVYQAMHEAGIEPDWVVGTSIGAINGALIAGNPPEKRMERLHEFWDRMELNKGNPLSACFGLLGDALTNANTTAFGIPGFFAPNPLALLGQRAKVGIEKASYYSTQPLRDTLEHLVDFDYLQSKKMRLTVGAVNANTGAMRYFDTRTDKLSVDHIMASGALPPAFPAIRIDGEPYWDGGIYSNTPVEVVLDDNPRRDSTIFAVQLWNPEGPEPDSLWAIDERQKEIQYASRDNSHIADQQQIHHLRHIVRELAMQLPAKLRESERVKELAAWGCGTTMHVVRLLTPRIEGEDSHKDIDFTNQGIGARRLAGLKDAGRAIKAAPWRQSVDNRVGVVVHNFARGLA